jgi:Fe2+ or Zn2+ uptake regulation protein
MNNWNPILLLKTRSPNSTSLNFGDYIFPRRYEPCTLYRNLELVVERKSIIDKRSVYNVTFFSNIQITHQVRDATFFCESCFQLFVFPFHIAKIPHNL